MGYQALIERIPAHIPPELVWDHNLAAYMQELDDPWLAGSRKHAGPDIVWATEAAYGQPGWVVTRYAPMQEVMLDHVHFTSEAPQMAPLLGVDWEMNPIARRATSNTARCSIRSSRPRRSGRSTRISAQSVQSCSSPWSRRAAAISSQISR